MIKSVSRGDADPVQAELEALVKKLRDITEAAPDIFRQLCGLARTHGLDPEEFRRRLVQAGLAYSRASELKTVLASAEQCTAFLQPPDFPGRQSWQETLAAARSERLQNEAGHTLEQQLAAQVAGRLHQLGQAALPVTGGWLVLESRAGDLEALL